MLMHIKNVLRINHNIFKKFKQNYVRKPPELTAWVTTWQTQWLEEPLKEWLTGQWHLLHL